MPPTMGTTVVAAVAVSTDWVHAIKKRETRIVEGRPATSPPIFVPYLSASTVPIVIQRLPVMKERISLRIKGSVIS